MRASPSFARYRAGCFVTSSPKSSTVPVDAGMSPQMTLKSVVFPAPFGPRIARRSPWTTSRSTSSHGEKPTETPADPPQAEGRLGVFDGRCCFASPTYLMFWLVMTPFLTTLILPCHGSFRFTQGG